MSRNRKELTVKLNKEAPKDEIMGVWMSQKNMDYLGLKVDDFIYASIGWSGSKSFRGDVKGTLPEGYGEDDIAVTADRLYEGNMTEGEQPKVWKHDDWY